MLLPSANVMRRPPSILSASMAQSVGFLSPNLLAFTTVMSVYRQTNCQFNESLGFGGVHTEQFLPLSKSGIKHSGCVSSSVLANAIKNKHSGKSQTTFARFLFRYMFALDRD
jgi:hypothetical protein